MGGASLSGQVALVTGGAKRIGRAIVERLAAEGLSVAVNYHQSRAEAEDLVRKLKQAGKCALALQADVSNRTEVGRMYSQIDDQFGRLDVLVNNAGVFFRVTFEELREEQWDQAMDVNLKAQFLCAQAAAVRMKRQGRGRIVNIASAGGLLPWPSYTHYCVSKAGVVMLTRCLARALAPEITVNCVAPGIVEFPDAPADQSFVRRTPMGRAGTADDIAEAVLFLIQSEFITGQILPVDGGRMLT